MGGRLYDALPEGKISAGENIAATLDYADYPRSGGWTLSVYFAGASNRAMATAASGTGADDFDLTIAATVTAAWMGGKYAYQVTAVHAIKGTAVAERGLTEVLPSPITQTPAMVNLAAINSFLAGTMTSDVLATSVDGIQLKYWMRDRGIDELFKVQSRIQSIVDGEIRRMGGAGGQYAIRHHAGEDHRLAGPYFGMNGRLR